MLSVVPLCTCNMLILYSLLGTTSYVCRYVPVDFRVNLSHNMVMVQYGYIYMDLTMVSDATMVKSDCV